MRIVGDFHELNDFGIDRDFLAACVDQGDEGDHRGGAFVNAKLDVGLCIQASG